VNLHPHHRINFTVWCKKIESKLETGEHFFKNRVGLFDAMPAFWKHMFGEHCHAVVAMIDHFYRKAEEDEREATTPWTVQNINNLLKYVALENIGQLRRCYITLKMDPSVFVESERDDLMAVEAAEADKQNAKLLCNYNFSWKPKLHVDAFERETKSAPDGSLEPDGRASEKTAMVFFTTSPILWHNFMAIQ
jgi:hypothetical protein